MGAKLPWDLGRGGYGSAMPSCQSFKLMFPVPGGPANVGPSSYPTAMMSGPQGLTSSPDFHPQARLTRRPASSSTPDDQEYALNLLCYPFHPAQKPPCLGADNMCSCSASGLLSPAEGGGQEAKSKVWGSGIEAGLGESSKVM